MSNTNQAVQQFVREEYQHGFVTAIEADTLPPGLGEDVIRAISARKAEPEWMLEFRLKGYEHYLKRPLPEWGADLKQINFEDIYYYIKPTEGQAKDWDMVPESIKETYEKLGIPEAERKYLAGDIAPPMFHVPLFWDVVELDQLTPDWVSIDTLLPKFPLEKAIGRMKSVPLDADTVLTARDLGVSFGDRH